MTVHDTESTDDVDDTDVPLASSAGAVEDDPEVDEVVLGYPETGRQDVAATSSRVAKSNGGPLRTGTAAVTWAVRQVSHPDFPDGEDSWHNLCLQFVRMCFGVEARYPSAEEAFCAAEDKRGTRGTPPRGVPVWWTNGGYGHVALSAGQGYCFSTDFHRHGLVDRVPITAITRGWGQHYRGWSADINGVVVWERQDPTPLRSVSIADVQQAARGDAGRAQGDGLHERDIRIVERALRREGLLDAAYADGYAGTAFRAAYARWQKRVVGPPYDGIPGVVSLTRLGEHHNFRVVD